MKEKNILPDRVKLLREKIGLAQADLGNYINLREPTIRGWEKGRIKIPMKHASEQIRDYLRLGVITKDIEKNVKR